MTQLTLPTQRGGESPFDSIRREDGYGEYWTARDLMPLMEYGRWDAFAAVVEKAKASLAIVEGRESVESNFLPIEGSQSRGRTGRLPGDYRLTRFACYLVAMAGDESKPAVAAARVYFAIRTRQAEIIARDHNLPRQRVPQTFAEALRAYADEVEQRERVEAQLAIAAPKAAQADHYRAAAGLTAIATFANDLQQWADETHGVKILHDHVRDFMAELGLLIRGNTIRNNEPTADAMKRRLMRIKHSTYERGDDREPGASRSARLTPKGCGFVWDRAVKRIAERGTLAPSTDLEPAREDR